MTYTCCRPSTTDEFPRVHMISGFGLPSTSQLIATSVPGKTISAVSSPVISALLVHASGVLARQPSGPSVLTSADSPTDQPVCRSARPSGSSFSSPSPSQQGGFSFSLSAINQPRTTSTHWRAHTFGTRIARQEEPQARQQLLK
jgi:hypothetical protein